jgi:L-seryl-tRNA(Ser) seleniumtransferase
LLPPWDNIPRLARSGIDLLAISGGKHMRAPQCAGILAGRKDLLRAA